MYVTYKKKNQIHIFSLSRFHYIQLRHIVCDNKWNYYDFFLFLLLLIQIRKKENIISTHRNIHKYFKTASVEDEIKRRNLNWGWKKISHPRMKIIFFCMISKHIIQIFIVLRGSNILFPFFAVFILVVNFLCFFFLRLWIFFTLDKVNRKWR